jgi:hypothetical protein
VAQKPKIPSAASAAPVAQIPKIPSAASAAPVTQTPKIPSAAEQAEDARLKLEEQRRLLQAQQDQIRRLEEVATRLDARAAEEREKAAKVVVRSGRKAVYDVGDAVFDRYSAAVNKTANRVNGGAYVLTRMQEVFNASGRYMELRVPQTRTRKALMVQLPIKTVIDGQEVITHLTITVPIFSQFFSIFLNFLTGNFPFQLRCRHAQWLDLARFRSSWSG